MHEFYMRQALLLAREAAGAGYIAPQDIARLTAFRDNPSDESWIASGGAPEG